jgi:hypothetical protein
MKGQKITKMIKVWLFLTLFVAFSSGSSILVQDGVYTRVTVQIEPQPQPENCVAFLDQLEVRHWILKQFMSNHIKSIIIKQKKQRRRSFFTWHLMSNYLEEYLVLLKIMSEMGVFFNPDNHKQLSHPAPEKSELIADRNVDL